MISIGRLLKIFLNCDLSGTHTEAVDADLSEGQLGHKNGEENWAFVPMKLAPGQRQLDIHIHWKHVQRDAELPEASAGKGKGKQLAGGQTRVAINAGKESANELLAAFQNWRRKGSKSEAIMAQFGVSNVSYDLHGARGQRVGAAEVPYFSLLHIPRTAGSAILSVFRQLLNCPATCSCR